MIALTQEKRQKRINWLKDRISSMEECRDEIPFGLIEDEEMELAAYKDSLASLTSEPVLYAVDNDVEDKIYTALCNENEDGAYPLFTVPPVLEIKLPEKLNAGEIHYELAEKYGLDVSIDQLECGMAEEVYSVAVNNFERLNGLGE